MDEQSTASLQGQFRGCISDVKWTPPSRNPRRDKLDLVRMAEASLNYLRNTPDPARGYECKFSLGPLGIPCHVPLMASTKDAFDPITLADTDVRMLQQFPHMREMVGEDEPCDVELGVLNRVRSYRRDDSLLWVNPAAWTGPEGAIDEEWATTWGTAKYLCWLADEFDREGDPELIDEGLEIIGALKGIAHWDGGRSFYPGGPVPWKAGQWLNRGRGWGEVHSHNYPFIVEPCVRFSEATQVNEGEEVARAFADGFLAGSQPDMGEQRIDPETGEFRQQVHIHTHAIWGVAHLGWVMN